MSVITEKNAIKVTFFLCISSFLFFFKPQFQEFYFSNKVPIEFKLKKLNDVELDFFSFINDKVDEVKDSVSLEALQGNASFQNGKSKYVSIALEDLDECWNSSSILFYNGCFESNTHDFQAHSLFILNDLYHSFLNTGNKKYLEFGKKILDSWLQNNDRFQLLPSHYSWGDHTTAMRLINVIAFVNIINEHSLGINVDLFNDYISKSVYFLRNDANYMINNNHGIFQDLALIYSLSYLNISEHDKHQLLTNILFRLEKQAEFAFTKSGIHRENSPGYHVVVTKLFSYAVKLLESNSIDCEQCGQISESVKLFKSNIHFLVDNNKIIAPVGDTINNVKYIDEIYKPGVDSIVDIESGYSVLKTASSYFLLRSDSDVQTHLHDDSSSFIFGDSKGLIFSEVGFLDYTNSKERAMTKSKFAHNKILIEDDYECSRIEKNESDDWFKLKLLCSNRNLELSRQFVVSKGELFLEIIDTVPGDYSLPLHISDDYTIQKVSDTTFMLVNKYNFDKLYLKLFGHEFSTELITGGKVFGWRADSFLHLYPSTTLLIHSNGGMRITLSSVKSNFSLPEFNSIGDVYEKQTLGFKYKPELRLMYDVKVILYFLVLLGGAGTIFILTFLKFDAAKMLVFSSYTILFLLAHTYIMIKMGLL